MKKKYSLIISFYLFKKIFHKLQIIYKYLCNIYNFTILMKYVNYLICIEKHILIYNSYK